MVRLEPFVIKSSIAYPIAVGVSIFLVLIFLDALHIGENSLWRAGLVGALCSIAVLWAGSKTTRKSTR
jgi:hypothetical protein